MESQIKYEFTKDWFTMHILNWEKWLSEFKDKPNLRFLEIGTFEGRSCLWLLENILTDPSSTIICIDPYIDAPLFSRKGARRRFFENLAKSGRESQVKYIGMKSQEIMKYLKPGFDFIYIDGDHSLAAVIEDAFAAKELIKPGGIIIFDNYCPAFKEVIKGVDIFIDVNRKDFDIVYALDIEKDEYKTGQVKLRRKYV